MFIQDSRQDLDRDETTQEQLLMATIRTGNGCLRAIVEQCDSRFYLYCPFCLHCPICRLYFKILSTMHTLS